MILERLTLSPEQLRAFVAVAWTGSFTRAAQRLGKTQSAVSQNIASLEAELGVVLLDRSGYRPTLTPLGQQVLAHAVRVVESIDAVGALARASGQGVEAKLSVAVDELVPWLALTHALRVVNQRYPLTQLVLRSGVLGDVTRAVLASEVELGVSGPLEVEPPRLWREPVGKLRMMPVAAPSHPLAQRGDALREADLRDHVQLVLSAPDEPSPSPSAQRGVVSATVWRIGSLAMRRALLLEGLGWGAMSEPSISEELAQGRLVQLRLRERKATFSPITLYAVTRSTQALGPAGRCFLDTLREALLVTADASR